MELEKYRLGGTALRSKDFEDGEVLTVEFKPNLKYLWDNGAAIGRYVAELKRGRIIARRCNGCGRVMLPPRMYCELCWRPTDRWVYVKDTGRVNTFSICHVNWDASRLPRGAKPHLPAVIEIDGASPGMGILHLLGEVDPKKIRVGMKVKAVWLPEDRRTGAITDIRYFKPV
ncbi:MAG: Zn-ribbon domain-containing OB-fold protein [bacterium]